MNAVKNSRILRESLKLEAKRFWEYKLNLAFDLLLRIVDGALFFGFWAIILGASTSFAGWTLQGFLLIFAFEAYFISTVLGFAYAALYVHKSIHSAELDSFLTKPASPWLLAMSKNISISYSGYITGTIALVIAALQGINFGIEKLAIIALMIALGGIITCLFGLCLACLSFWLGRMESLETIFESFWNFQGRPANIFPPALQLLVAFTFPFIFTQTIPALSILEKISTAQLLTSLIMEIAVLIIWYFAFKILWTKGLRNYESGSG